MNTIDFHSASAVYQRGSRVERPDRSRPSRSILESFQNQS